LKNILIVGGAGFIGSNLSRELVIKGYCVTILDVFNEQIHGKLYTQGYLYQSLPKEVTLVKGDALNEQLLLSLLEKNEVVVHMVSETGTAQSMYRLRHYTNVNIGSVAVLMDLLVNNATRVKKVFLASSRAVYGEGRYTNEALETVYPKTRQKSNLENNRFDLYDEKTGDVLAYHPIRESDRINPVSIYGFSKYAQEQVLQITAETYGIDFCILRYQNVYGPGQSLLNSYTGVLNVFATRALLNKPLNIFEDGKGLRDFIFVDDAVKATIMAMESDASMNQVYNIGTGVGVSIFDAAISISKALHSEVVCEVSGNYRYGDIRHSIADIRKAQKELGFVPKHSFMEGLQKFIDWVRTQDLSLDQSDETFTENLNKGVLRLKE
jgi:dTDP-L-rhamnose 4-epimerase